MKKRMDQQNKKHPKKTHLYSCFIVVFVLMLLTCFIIPDLQQLIVVVARDFAWLWVPCLCGIIGLTGFNWLRRKRRSKIEKRKGLITASLGISIVLMIVASVWLMTNIVRVIREVRFQSSSRDILGALKAYAYDHNGKWPNGHSWCDLLLEDDYLDPKSFNIKGEKSCNFTINTHALELGIDMPDDMVLFFESKPGWNQVGDSELFYPGKHYFDFKNKGYIKFLVIGHWVNIEEARKLRWELNEKSKP